MLIHNGVDGRRFSPGPRDGAALARGAPLLRPCMAGQACTGAGFRSSLEQQAQAQQQAQKQQQQQQAQLEPHWSSRSTEQLQRCWSSSLL